MSWYGLHDPTSSTFLTITNGSLIYTNTLNYSTNNNFLIVPGGIYGSISLLTNGSVGLVATSALAHPVMPVTNIWISGSTLSVSSSLITGNLVYTNLLLLNFTNRTFSTLTIPALNLGGGILTNVASSSILNVQDGTLSINSGTTFASRLYVTNGSGGVLNFNAGLLASFGSIVSNGLSLKIGDGTNVASLILPSGSHTFADGLTIAANASLSNASSLNASNLVISASGRFTMSEGFAVVNIVTNSGIFIQSGGIFDPAFYHNTGTLQLTGGTNQDTVFLNDVGAIVQHSGGQLDVSVATNFGSWTVSGTAAANLTNFINQSGATLSITGGTFNTSQLTATNAGNILNFRAGQIHSGGSTVSNGVAFTVGDGVKSATLDLLGGTHSFANGIFINTNSWLTGTGAITGIITNAGSIAPGDSPGILTISGDLTLLNNSRLLMELAGTNNGLY
ncbi:MAG: hypothetical protein HZA88_19955, partial [Verrucomicrobia bacterium]|nr:hypothetical protein [Verrucomicrobiota bacterium]